MSEIHNEITVIQSTIGVKKDLVIFDVGACNFIDTMHLKRHFPHAKVYSFEPNVENIKLHSPLAESQGAIVVPVAVSDKNDLITFYNSVTHDGAGSTLKPIVKENTTEGIYHDGVFYDMYGYEVQCVRLDTFCELNEIDHIDYLHIDVQGAEHNVIRGLGKYRPYFIFAETCEFGTYESGTTLEEFEKDLHEMGYEVVNRFRDDTLYKLKTEFTDFKINNWLPKI
jgi:FkbM family methyltransferase